MDTGRYDQVADLNAITMRQLNEDVTAYKYDLEFCNEQLTNPHISLTPQESRTLQLRRLDMGHNIRHCNHRMEMIRLTAASAGGGRPVLISDAAAAAAASARNVSSLTPAAARQQRIAAIKRSSSEALDKSALVTPTKPSKKARGSSSAVTVSAAGTASAVLVAAAPKAEEDEEGDGEHPQQLELKRLGYWRCRLCVSTKYLLAGAGRQPSAPCKWPLKDIAKMITHYMDMHTEHEPAERCKELGDALDTNRGPFEYWLRRSRSQNLEDNSIIDECIEELQTGQLPDVLRRLSRAAASFPQELLQIAVMEDGAMHRLSEDEQRAQESSRFLRLPAEIRVQIYRFAVVRAGEYAWSFAPPALAHVSRQVREEALSIYYSENSFILGAQHGPRDTVDLEESMDSFLPPPGCRLARWIRNVRTVSMEYTQPYSAAAQPYKFPLLLKFDLVGGTSLANGSRRGVRDISAKRVGTDDTQWDIPGAEEAFYDMLAKDEYTFDTMMQNRLPLRSIAVLLSAVASACPLAARYVCLSWFYRGKDRDFVVSF
ncbi:uncharacterized protein E0L32_005134 [Thyridium curvatum]|uniref:Uncharacterized protein n=1 Tax=Thyridium curvatum TaxID=1093900 RepID=A0A507BBI1_9PEZI|nr:uncharacterized protein E0L32_005134 [Thyridium curvatum]TPX14739.1 hypothetical protein E0L32_005134 [Thyridium curvatum]